MKNAIILHGRPDKDEYYSSRYAAESNSHWIPWLQKELITHDIKADTPEVPHSYNPQWELWRKEVERFEITPETILVGHSCGSGFWIKYLSINKHLKVGKVVLVAPWLDPAGETQEKSFFEFEIDPNIASRTDELIIYYAPDDHESVLKTVNRIRSETKNTAFREFPEGYKHFCEQHLGTKEFPELRDETLGKIAS